MSSMGCPLEAIQKILKVQILITLPLSPLHNKEQPVTHST